MFPDLNLANLPCMVPSLCSSVKRLKEPLSTKQLEFLQKKKENATNFSVLFVFFNFSDIHVSQCHYHVVLYFV